jgi:hypothetical protein
MLYLVIFVIEVAGDYFSCKWHKARESKNQTHQIIIAMFLQLLNWIPVWFAIKEEDPMIVVVSIIGTGLGNYLGSRKDSDTVV